MSKVNVNGPKTSEVYRWLRTHSTLYNKKTKKATKIPWNYAKFLINGKTGEVVKYFTSVTSPNEMEVEIKKLVGSKKKPKNRLKNKYSKAA